MTFRSRRFDGVLLRGRLMVAWLAATILTSGWVTSIEASQLTAHIYAAIEARKKIADPKLREMLTKHEAAYLAGSCGPDIANTAHYAQVKLGWNAPGTEGHKLRTGQIVMNLLKHAMNDRDRAFALGWLTHHQVDCVIHPLVNRYGGYFEEDPDRHMALEMVETEHVFHLAEKAGHRLEQYRISVGDDDIYENVAPSLVIKAFAATFADKPNVKEYQTRLVPMGDGRTPEIRPANSLPTRSER